MACVRGFVGVLALVLLTGCQQPAAESSTETGDTSASNESLVERGRYLVETSACNDCHTPKLFTGQGLQLDPDRHLAGHPAEAGVMDFLPAELGMDPGQWGAVTNNHLTAWGGPWGISFGINLTPDQETGIGSWTEEMFIDSLREGKHQGTGRTLLPPMPWMFYGQRSDEDLRAMYVYLMSLPPVRNPVPEPVAIEDLRRR